MSVTPIRTRSELNQLLAKTRRNPVLSARIAARVATRLSEIAGESFDQGRSVYGDPWLGRNGSQLTLKKSGALRRLAVRYLSQGRKVTLSVGALRYARFQLGRFWYLPKAGAANVPAKWNAEIRRIAAEEIKSYFGEVAA